MTDPVVDKAQKAAQTLRQLAENAAQSMGTRQADLDAHADVAEIVLALALHPRS